MSRGCSVCTAPDEPRNRINRTLRECPTWTDSDVARYAQYVGLPVSRFVIARHRKHYLLRELGK
jgi:hypothetical protein